MSTICGKLMIGPRIPTPSITLSKTLFQGVRAGYGSTVLESRLRKCRCCRCKLIAFLALVENFRKIGTALVFIGRNKKHRVRESYASVPCAPHNECKLRFCFELYR